MVEKRLDIHTGGSEMTLEDLKRRKIELGYSNEMISAKSGVPLGTVQKIFGGTTKKPRFNTLQSIQCVLFPELHSPKEAALYKDIVHNLTLDYADRVDETNAFDEYRYEMPEEEHKVSYEQVMSWKQPGEFTVEDWINLPDGSVMELIDGVLYDRNTPTTRHQFIVMKLTIQLDAAIESKGKGHCLVLSAPTGVQPDADDEKNGLIPDVLLVCDKEKYKGKEIIVGAPDFVAEVLSPSTEKYDRTKKFIKYWKAGVREYWVIDLENEVVLTYMFGEKTIVENYSFEDQIPLGISNGEIVVDFRSISDRMHQYFD